MSIIIAGALIFDQVETEWQNMTDAIRFEAEKLGITINVGEEEVDADTKSFISGFVHEDNAIPFEIAYTPVSHDCDQFFDSVTYTVEEADPSHVKSVDFSKSKIIEVGKLFRNILKHKKTLYIRVAICKDDGGDMSYCECIPSEMWVQLCGAMIGTDPSDDPFSPHAVFKLNKEYSDCYTYFSIKGDFDDPDEIAGMLGIEPFEKYKKGELTKYGGKRGIRYAESTLDICRCGEYERDIGEQLEKTVATLMKKVDILNEIRKRYDVEYTLWAVPTLAADELPPAIHLSPEIMRFCADTDTEFDCDLYMHYEEENET